MSRQPKIFLTPTVLTALQARAAVNSPEWVALKSQCDLWLTGHVEWADGDHYPGIGNIGEGYQGDDYYHAVVNLGLCYQVAKTIDPTHAPLYAAKGIDVLLKMSVPQGTLHAVNPLRDSGYGIRFYGVGMAIGYDWFYDALTPDQRTTIVTALNVWVDAFAKSGFGHDHPQGNYFAGYYAASGLAALATEDDTRWQDWLTRIHNGFVQPYYEKYLKGGGWPEGWNYGRLASLNMSWPTLAAKSAKSLDLIGGSTPFTFPVSQGLHLIHFTWPSRLSLDDRGRLYPGDNPSALLPLLITPQAGLMSSLQAQTAPQFHRYAREVRELQTGKADLWQEFLFWDETAFEQDYRSQPLSYLARGMNMVAARSSWATDAVWSSFTASPYINYSGSGEEFYD